MSTDKTRNYDEPQDESTLQVREAGDYPQEEMTPNTVDDIDADLGPVAESALETAGNGCGVPWRVAKSLLTLRDQVNEAAPQRKKVSDGTIGDPAHCQRRSDHNPWVRDGNKGVVTAMDITDDPARGCSAESIAESIRESEDPRVKYIIWNRRIANSSSINGSPAWAWRNYTGSNPHTKHIHISVKSDKPNYDSTTQWEVTVG
jgi:hypothetical protein